MKSLIWGFGGLTSQVINNLIDRESIEPKVWFYGEEVNSFCQRNSVKLFDMVEFLRIDTYDKTYINEINEYCDGIPFNYEVYQKVFSNIWHYIDCESRGEACNFIKPIHWYLNKFNMLYKFVYAVLVKEEPLLGQLQKLLKYEGSLYSEYTNIDFEKEFLSPH